MNHATHIVMQAVKEMADRAKTYDSPDGERSMPIVVDAFRAFTGIELSVEQGWLFMVCLKIARSQQGEYREDCYVDLNGYGGLMGEAACEARNGGWTPEAIKAAALPPKQLRKFHPVHATQQDWDKAEARMDNIGPNGNEGEHYQFEELAKLIDHAPSWADHLFQPISSRSVYARNAEGRDHLLSQTVAASDEELTMPLPPVHWLICTDNENQEELLSESKKYSTRSNPSANLITVTDDNGQIGQFRGNRFKPFTETQKPLEQVEVVTP